MTPPEEDPTGKSSKTMVGTVEKIIPAIGLVTPEKAQISIEGAEDLYREIRIENTLEDQSGNSVGLKKGVEVEVTINAEPEATVKK